MAESDEVPQRPPWMPPAEGPDGPPGWDQDEADWLIGKYALVGVTYLKADGNTVKSQAQYHGKIVSAEKEVGVAIACEGRWTGETMTLPRFDWLTAVNTSFVQQARWLPIRMSWHRGLLQKDQNLSGSYLASRRRLTVAKPERQFMSEELHGFVGLRTAVARFENRLEEDQMDINGQLLQSGFRSLRDQIQSLKRS